MRIIEHFPAVLYIACKLRVMILLHVIIHEHTDRYYHTYGYDTDVEDHFGL